MQPFPQTYRKFAYTLATGQVTSYATGDDGELQLGLVKAYTVLTAGQYSGTTNIVLNGKTDAHSNNCVFDNNTRKMWSRTPSASVGPTSNGLLPWTTNGSGEGIFTYLAAANAVTLAGYNDWRIPNRNELFQLYGCSATTAIPDGTAFPGWPTAANVFTSTTRPNLTTDGISILLPGGIVTSNTKVSTVYVVMVRL